MKIADNDSKITFCQLLPTAPLLRSAAKIHNFEDAKSLNISVNIKYSGWISFYKRAIKIADEVIKKNPEITKIVDAINKADNIKQKNALINKFVNTNGENIDVIL